MLAMLSAMHSMSEAALAPLMASAFPAGVTQLGQASQAQWQATIEAMTAMSQLPRASLDQAVREVARLREAISVMQLQLTAFDQQLATVEAVIRPLQQWSHAWRPPA
jgi:septal ring factor EnvC (AmiA/AmiB activator)